MTTKNTVTFDDSNDFDFDANKIEVLNGARLKLVSNPGQFFSHPTSGYTYDTKKTNVSGGIITALAQFEGSDPIFSQASMANNVNLLWGSSKVGTLSGTAVYDAVNKEIDMPNANNSACQYNGSGNFPDSIFTVRFLYKPNYTDLPNSNKDIFFCRGNGNLNNGVLLIHSTSRILRLTVYDINGNIAAQINGAGVFSPISGTNYEIELAVDSSTGRILMYVDGVEKIDQYVAPFTRGTPDYFGFGSYTANAVNGSFSKLLIFNSIKHTANYTPELNATTLIENIYISDQITFPSHIYSGNGILESFNSFAASITDTPKFTLNNKYFDGNSWVNSNNTYSQANTKEVINANISTLTPSDTLTIKCITPTQDVASSVSSTSVGYTGEWYPVDLPTIKPKTSLLADDLSDFVSTIIQGVGNEIRFILELSGINKYWDGLAWSNSLTALDSNTLADFAGNLDSLDIAGGEDVRVIAVFVSDGQTSPEIDSYEYNYSFYFPIPEPTGNVSVYGNVRDVGFLSPSKCSIIVSQALPAQRPPYLVSPSSKTISVRNDGRFEFETLETATLGDKLKFEIKVFENGAYKTYLIGYTVIPDQPYVDVANLTFTQTP
jgi:hypothetical protein